MFTVWCTLCETDINGATVVVVEHADQHPASLLAELAHVPVHQSPLELSGRNLATAVSIHRLEPPSDLLLLSRRLLWVSSSAVVVHFEPLIVNRSLEGLVSISTFSPALRCT